MNNFGLKDGVLLLMIVAVGFYSMHETNSLRLELVELKSALNQGMRGGMQVPGGMAAGGAAANDPGLPPVSPEEQARIDRFDALAQRNRGSAGAEAPVAPVDEPAGRAAPSRDINLDKAMLAVSMLNLPRSLSKIPVKPTASGLVLTEVSRGSLASLLELETGDEIKTADGKPVTSLADLGVFFKLLERNGRATLRIRRENQDVEFFYRAVTGSDSDHP